MMSRLSSKLGIGRSSNGERRLIPTSALTGDALLEAVVAEVHNLAADVVAVTSSLNAPLTQASRLSLRSIRNFLPRSDARTTLVPAASREAEVLRAAAGRLSAWLEAIEIAVAGTEAMLTTIETEGVVPRSIALHEAASRKWRKSAALALDLIDMLEPESRWRLAGAYSENSLILCRSLRLVATGKAPAIDSRDELARPSLPQQRRAPRYALRTVCRIWNGARATRAETIDISSGGIGLLGEGFVKLRDNVDIEFEDGRRIAATVVWSRDNRTGLQFNEQLLRDDPLLSRMN